MARKHFLHGRCLAKNLRCQRLGCRCTMLGRHLFQSTAHQRNGLIDVERLGQVFERASLKRRDGGIKVGIGGHDDDRQIGMILLHLPEQIEAARPGHANIRHQHARRIARRQFRQCLVGGTEARTVDLFASQRLFEHPANRAVVVDDPDRIHVFSPFPAIDQG